MNSHVDLQHACSNPVPVADKTLIHWVNLALDHHQKSAELTLRLVDEEEMIYLNSTYRHQNKTTNVLAFPSTLPQGIELECFLLGDVIICPSVLQKESQAFNKPLEEHWALIVIHGVLHLLGYDHIKENEALVMQTLEIKLLSQLGFSNPYRVDEDAHSE